MVVSIAVGIRCLDVQLRVRNFVDLWCSMKPRRLVWVFCWKNSTRAKIAQVGWGGDVESAQDKV
jgi:hypothetical protein